MRGPTAPGLAVGAVLHECDDYTVQLEARKKLTSWIATENEKDLKLAFPRLALGRAKNAPAG